MFRQSSRKALCDWLQLSFSAYCRRENGSVTVFVVIMFAFLMAFGGMIFDVARVFNLHSQSQAYADTVALAAAAELDGEAGSLQRAIRAATGDTQRAALLGQGDRLTLSGDNSIGIESIIFLESITDDPAPNIRSPVPDDQVLCTYIVADEELTCVDGIDQAEADGLANYVLVNTTVEEENFILFPIAAAFIPGSMESASVQPQAIAGFTREICNFPPMAICNPYENTTAPYGGDFTVIPGQQILLQTQGASASWAPGDFGFLDLSEVGPNGCTGGGADYLRCVLGALNPNTACTSATVDMSPGQTTSADAGLNVRFGIYDPPLQNETSNPNFAPDINVTKGYRHNNNQCRLNQLTATNSQTMGLPRDRDVSVTKRIGSGVNQTDLATYWSTNHNGASLPTGVDTRYKAYLKEIETGIPNKSSTGGENGNPTCGPAAQPDRRRIIVATMNCMEHNVKGSSNNVPVIKFIEMFLTEEAGDPVANSEHDIYAEVIGVVEPGGHDGVLHEYPVLYR